MGLARNGWTGSPTARRPPLISPSRANNIDHMIDTITHDVTTGRKKAVRRTIRPRSGSFIMNATRSDKTVSPIIAKKVK